MARSHTHLTPEERHYIRKRLTAGDSLSGTARLMGRSPSAVSRELKRNTGLRGCRPKQAQRLADGRHADSRRGVRLTEAVRSQVIRKPRLDWSSGQIPGRMRVDGGDWVSCETIHRMVWRDKRAGGDLHTHLRHSSRKRRKRCGKNDFRGRLPGRTDISGRPAVVDARSRFGDWEGDTVIGKGRRGGLVTLAGRKSRALLAGRIARKAKAETADALRRITKGLEGIIDTITVEAGREFADHFNRLGGHRQRRLLRPPLPQLGARASASTQTGFREVLPQVHAARPGHRRAGPARGLQDQQPAAQVPWLQNTGRGLAKRLRFWRNYCLTERCT